MSAHRIVWRGESFISVTEAASCYGLEARDIEVWFELDLLEPPRRVEGVDAISVEQLDRLAALIQYTRILGLDPEIIRLLL